jgi:hypothetical protein
MSRIKRGRKQAVQNMNHLAPRQRPNYKKAHDSVADGIVRERVKAARMAAANSKKKK